MFRLAIDNPTGAEALNSQNLVCQVTGIVYEVEEFRSPVLVKQCYNCQSFRHSAKTCRSKQNVSSAERTIPIKDAQIEKQGNQNTPTVRGYMLHLIKGVQNTKKQSFKQHVINNQKPCVSIVSQNTLPQPKTNNEILV